MKPLIGRPFDQWRNTSAEIIAHYGSVGDETCGVFNVPVLSTGVMLRVIASSEEWEHVSVSLPDRCPTWDEMVYLKRAFFKKDEWAIEFHPPESKNISVHPYCLHLWRSYAGNQPLPPAWMVG